MSHIAISAWSRYHVLSMRWFLLLGLCACSGADKQDVLGDSTGAASTTTPTSTATTTPTSTTTSTTAPVPSAPFTNCGDTEKEPNDDAAHANQLNGSICGTIASATDSDFVTFKLKGGTKKMSLKFDGKVTLKITVGTQTVTLGNGQNPEIPFSKTDRYVIQVQGIDKSAMPTWRVEVDET